MNILETHNLVNHYAPAILQLGHYCTALLHGCVLVHT